MAGAIRQEDHRSALVDRLAMVTRRAEVLRDALSPVQLAWSPPEGGWGVAQVLQHLTITNADYFPLFESLIAGSARRPTGAADPTWQPSILGNFMIRSLQSPRRMPAPKPWRPSPAVPPDITHEFLAGQVRLGQLMEQAAALSWRATRLRSPMSGLIRFNLGDAFTILVAHEERHFGQIDRVRAHPAFPPGGSAL